MAWDLTVIWAGIIGLAVALYVILDGFDLGVGILFPFSRDEIERDQMIGSVAPFWDGNETWLVLGGAGLWIAFPRAYAIIMSALYLPVIVMLLSLVFRGVAFEFRAVADDSKRYWNVAFAAGSALAALSQGVILGGLIQGIEVADGAFAGSAFDWLTPFALICGLGVLCGYALLGATWLVMKTEGAVATQARQHAGVALVAVLAAMALVSLWTPLAFETIAERWFSTPNIYYLWPMPVLTALTAFLLWRWLHNGREIPPFIAAVALFLLGYAGLVISVFPFLVPPTLTIWDTAAAPSTQLFMLVGTVGLLPIILGYVAFVYWVFRGKVRRGEGYHH
ncbi:MAG: cytochrome d ubiquinol oxidase subunit II [Hyphomicrobiales bacterium]|nr:cytochrome d ubiquinol oxidase subunit II [Hyphomicrobiales bacterium]